MLDHTTRILLEKYQPDSPLLQVEVSEPEPVEVEKASITMEELAMKVRSEMLTSWGLNPDERHAFADETVAWATVLKCKEYNVTDLPPEGLAWL
ncbi:hypothetical protein [Pseudomonas sp. GW101-3H06]|uniref:hypothetical protein n=1 Tax=Pseudomonas sp. GW101-3H06 TaxID=2751347 RepID=UPI001A924F5A|nr:hypothetical protein [Pseudomonas sp. GW101-3H06]